MRKTLSCFKQLANEMCQCLLSNKIVVFIRKQLREKPMFLAFVAFFVSLLIAFYITDISIDIFALVYAASQGVERRELSEDYGFGMMGFLFSVFVFFLSLPILYFFIKKQLMRFSHYE